MGTEKILTKLSEQVELINNHINKQIVSGRKISLLEIDTLKQKTIDLYDLLFELEKAAANKHTPTEKQTTEVDIPIKIEEEATSDISETATPPPTEDISSHVNKIEEVKEEIVSDEDNASLDKDNNAAELEHVESDFEDIAIEDAIDAEENEIIQEFDELPKNEEKEVIKEPIKPESTPPTPNQTTYDLFSVSNEDPLGEKLHQKDSQSIADKMQNATITNIREAIGINDKFLFINELFNGDLQKYNSVIDDIDGFTTKKGIETYLLELKIQYQWDDEGQAFIKLTELTNRKFG